MQRFILDLKKDENLSTSVVLDLFSDVKNNRFA